MTAQEAAAMYSNAVAHGEDPGEAAAIVDGGIGGYAGRHQVEAACVEARLKTLEENVAWVIRSLAKLTDALVRLNKVAQQIEARQKEVSGEL